MARFCLATGFTPEMYWSLTLEELSAFIDALEERHTNGI
jgi:hypothetical protein